jgi:hypothetical protein
MNNRPVGGRNSETQSHPIDMNNNNNNGGWNTRNPTPPQVRLLFARPSSQTNSATHSAHLVPEIFPVPRPELETDQSPQSNAEVWNAWGFVSTLSRSCVTLLHEVHVISLNLQKPIGPWFSCSGVFSRTFCKLLKQLMLICFESLYCTDVSLNGLLSF